MKEEQLKNLENNLQLELGRLFRLMNERVQEELRKYWNDTLLLQGHIDLILSPIHELHQEYNHLLLEYRKTVFEKGYDEGKRLVIRELKKNRFALKSEPVTIKYESNELFGTIRETERMLEQDTFTATESTLSRVDKNINQILTDGYKEGKGIKEVSNRIQQRFNQLETWEANRIARTEIHSSHSLGRRQSYLDLDVEYVEWSSAHDKRVRGHKKTDLANHMIMDGEIKPINEKYSNGLLYPGDKSGRIEEWVNCRCSEAPVIMPPDRMAPVGQTQFREADIVSVAPVNTDSLLRRATGGKLGWSEFRKVLGGASVESVVRGAAVEATKEPTQKQLKTNLTKEELEQVKWAKDVQTSKYVSETGKAKARETLNKLYEKALNGKPKPAPVKTPTKPKTTAPITKSVENMTSKELYESMTKADKKKYDKYKQKVANANKNIKQLGESPLLLDIKKKNLLELRKLEQKQRDKLQNKGKPKTKQKPTKTYKRTLDNIHNDIEIPTEELIPKLEKWIKKRCKNTVEFGYNFNTKTGELIGKEIRGTKGHVTITDMGKGTGTIHSHPRNGMSAPSVADLESFRCEKGQHHFMVSEHEIWYVKSTDNFGIGGMGQQLDLHKAHDSCRQRAYDKVAKEIKKGKIEPTEDVIAEALNKYTGDEILKTFNSPPWSKTMAVKRYYI